MEGVKVSCYATHFKLLMHIWSLNISWDGFGLKHLVDVSIKAHSWKYSLVYKPCQQIFTVRRFSARKIYTTSSQKILYAFDFLRASRCNLTTIFPIRIWLWCLLRVEDYGSAFSGQIGKYVCFRVCKGNIWSTLQKFCGM